MALSAIGLSAPIKDAFLAAGAADNAATTAFALALATAIVDHIKANAVVVPTLLVAPPGGGPVTGTGTIT